MYNDQYNRTVYANKCDLWQMPVFTLDKGKGFFFVAPPPRIKGFWSLSKASHADIPCLYDSQ